MIISRYIPIFWISPKYDKQRKYLYDHFQLNITKHHNVDMESMLKYVRFVHTLDPLDPNR